MNACKTCSEPIDGNEKYVLCSGACNRLFHVNCAGLNITNFKAWSSNVGLLWFCDACRVNFNPTVVDRESHILRALRDLLVRVDSMDLRIGQYAENMKAMNSLLSFSHVRRESNVDMRFQQQSAGTTTNASADFHRSIDRLNLNSSLNSCLGTSFSEHDEPVTSETTAASLANRTAAITTTTTAIPNLIVATTTSTSVPATTSSTVNSTITTNISSTNCTTTTSTVASGNMIVSGTPNTATATSSSNNTATNNLRQTRAPSNRLKVVNRNERRPQPSNTDAAEELNSFYITPFHVEQTEEDVLEYLRETVNIGNSTVRCAKLVPRGRQVNELTFVSFKVSVSPDLATVVGDSFYWPDGVNVREFQPKNDMAPINLRPPLTQ